MNIFHAKFSTGQVVAATGVSNATLQSWLKRNVIIGHREQAEIEGGGSPGIHRRFSFFNVMEIATAKALIDCGMSDLREAFLAAAHFSHTGGGATSLNPDRIPGVPFDTSKNPGYTLLCVSGDKSRVVHWRPGKDPLANVRHTLGNPPGYFVLEMNPIFDRVVAALGYHPEQVFEIAYPREGTH